MALFGRVTARTMVAAADLRQKQYHVLRAAGAGTTDVASNAAGGVDDVIGVLQNKPNSGQAAAVGYEGETKLVVGDVVTVNANLAPNGVGRVIDAASGDYVVAEALEAATTDGEVIRALLSIPAKMQTTSLNV